MKHKILVIDGNSLMFRGFYAISTQMTSPDGRPTNAIFGFLGMLLKAMDAYTPDHILVAFDMYAPTFRHKQYADYKAGRRETPPDLIPQFDMLRALLSGIGIAWREAEGFEADDILGTAARLATAQGYDALLVTGDRDALQLVDESIRVIMTKKGVSEIEEFTPAHLMEVYGLRPDQIPDLKGLMGDSSDNIPGIPGVGEKTALKLLGEYETLENVLSHGEDIKGKLGERVREHAQSARFSKELATIHCDAPIDADLSHYAFAPFGRGALDALSSLGMTLYVRRLREAMPKEDAPEAPDIVYEQTDFLPASPEGPAALLLTPEALQIATEGRQLNVSLHRDLLDTFPEPEDCLKALKPFFEGDQLKILYDVKRWMERLAELDIMLHPPYFDVMIAEYLLEPLQSQAWEDIALRYGYASAEACALFDLRARQHTLLEQRDMLSLYDDIELPLAGVLYDMQREGFAVDCDVLRALGVRFDQEISQLTREIFDYAGEEFNINSTKQLGVILFEKLSLPAGRKTKTGWSTDAAVLEQLKDQHPIIPAILRYRTLTKLKSTYIDGLLPLVRDGRIHSTFNQVVTATGRISSSDPNLQNIPVREEDGRQIRAAFIARDADHILVDADYSQIELRVLAHMSGDERMRAAFLSGKDIHTQTASEVFNVPLEEVTPHMRSSSKAVNFGIVYGISDFGLAAQLGIPRGMAREYIDRYLDTYPGVRAFMEEMKRLGREQGYVSTMLHRRRPMPELKSDNYNTRSFGERVAMNAPIQGSAADIIKLAMVHVPQRLREAGLSSKLILQVHDELIVDACLDEAEEVERLLVDTMEQVVELSVPLVVDVSRGRSWLEAK